MSTSKTLLLTPIFAVLGMNSVQAEEPTAEDYYYGFGVKQDYTKAYKMFTDEKNISYLVMMLINGEGREKDLQQAKELLEKEAENCFHLRQLRSEIEERKTIPSHEQKPVTFCDLAYTTPELNFCGYIQNKLAEQRHLSLIKHVSTQLPTEAQTLLQKIEELSMQIQDLDSERMYITYMEGSIRGLARSGTKGYIKDRHHNRIQNILSKQKLTKYSSSDFQTADDKLNTVYQQRRTGEKEVYEERCKMNPDPQSQSHMQSIMKDQLENLKRAQLAWINYRDLWVELLLLHRPTGFENDQNIRISIKTLLSRERVEELHFDPIGPG